MYKLIDLFSKVLSVGLLIFVSPVFAKDLSVVIKLHSVEVRKTSEKSGDELYLDVTQYSSLGSSRTDRIPKAPLHWKSSNLAQVKDLSVWEGSLKAQEEVKIILSLVEQDFPPWDLDDLIGSCQLILMNNQGKLETKWGLPVFEEKVEVVMSAKANPQFFVMKGDNSEYNISFSVHEN
jgi:hypothetical protein